MGALESNSDHFTSDYYYDLSRTLVFEKLRMNEFSSIVMIQTLLVLAIYDLGKGNNISAWLLSGIAIRIGEHKGLSQDPKNWKSDIGETNLTEYDIEVRSRIYWGCFITEHFIANVLGRMSILNLSQATIRDTIDLPILPGINKFCYSDPLKENFDIKINFPEYLNCLSGIYSLTETYKSLIFHKMGSRRNGSKFGKQSLAYLNEFIGLMLKWREDLPMHLKWDLQTLETDGHNPVRMNIRNQYYLALLTFQKPFMNSLKVDSRNENFTIDFCLEIIKEIEVSAKSFIKVEKPSKCSIIVVYNIILSIMILIIILTKFEKDTADNKLDSLVFFVGLLKELSLSWELAGIYYNSIQNTYVTVMERFQKVENEEQDMKISTMLNNPYNNSNLTQGPNMDGLQFKAGLDIPLDFESVLVNSENISNIFSGILQEMPTLEDGFVSFEALEDLSSPF